MQSLCYLLPLITNVNKNKNKLIIVPSICNLTAYISCTFNFRLLEHVKTNITYIQLEILFFKSSHTPNASHEPLISLDASVTVINTLPAMPIICVLNS